jgi:hypothetical protein
VDDRGQNWGQVMSRAMRGPVSGHQTRHIVIGRCRIRTCARTGADACDAIDLNQRRPVRPDDNA